MPGWLSTLSRAPAGAKAWYDSRKGFGLPRRRVRGRPMVRGGGRAMDEAGGRGAGRDAQARKVKGRLMHQANRALVLNLIRRHPSLSRARIARETGLSPATVGTIVDHLLAENLVHEETKVATGAVGRRPVGLRFTPQARQALGIDIDVLEITAALVD